MENLRHALLNDEPTILAGEVYYSINENELVTVGVIAGPEDCLVFEIETVDTKYHPDEVLSHKELARLERRIALAFAAEAAAVAKIAEAARVELSS